MNACSYCPTTDPVVDRDRYGLHCCPACTEDLQAGRPLVLLTTPGRYDGDQPPLRTVTVEIGVWHDSPRDIVAALLRHLEGFALTRISLADGHRLADLYETLP